jgi:hypothetical protein
MLSEKHWTTLLDKIKTGSCTPFIGAGASLPLLPLAKDLAEKLLCEEEERTKKKYPLKDRTDLARVTQYLAVTHEDGLWVKSKIAELIKDAQKPDFRREGEPHALLADLGLPVYLTTNYDDFLVAAFNSRHRPFQREFCRWNRKLLEEYPSEFDAGFEPTPATPVVFHLHGHAELPETMVASEDDYLDFLVNISKDLAGSPAGHQQRAMLPARIRRAITSTTLLFVGYGLADINFRVILRGLVGSLERSGRQIHITVQFDEGKEDAAEVRNYMEQYFSWTLDLKVFWGSSGDFAKELRQRWAEHA